MKISAQFATSLHSPEDIAAAARHTGTATVLKRITLRTNATHLKVGQYHEQTYSHNARITNLPPDIR
jgi:hypothetical protein